MVRNAMLSRDECAAPRLASIVPEIARRFLFYINGLLAHLKARNAPAAKPSGQERPFAFNAFAKAWRGPAIRRNDPRPSLGFSRAPVRSILR
ncbi:MAG TPA: hypothetical protein VMD53_06565 [Rhizomicrobium sp.]|nr:hypothetical protein [Rhizomicrobium sp.]